MWKTRTWPSAKQPVKLQSRMHPCFKFTLEEMRFWLMKTCCYLCIPDACFYLLASQNTITKDCKPTLTTLCTLDPQSKTDSKSKRLTPSVLTMMGMTVVNGYIMCHARSESWFVSARQNEKSRKQPLTFSYLAYTAICWAHSIIQPEKRK